MAGHLNHYPGVQVLHQQISLVPGTEPLTRLTGLAPLSPLRPLRVRRLSVLNVHIHYFSDKVFQTLFMGQMLLTARYRIIYLHQDSL